ncbi:MAG: xanthine dehydrogenase family protein subunit M [Candidatus Rokubacteria bacterium]|nr:xanthine dehydrogenase family protein subunit M [Candidatus Rokubacteria bacterium]
MKPPRFDYHDPTTLAEALALLAGHGDAARVLAGGQSLMPMLNFRLARPGHVIDVNRLDALATLSPGPDAGLRIGALVRQRTLERSTLIRERCPLIAQAMPLVGHPQIRTRGTLGGSLAHADPAAELPAVMVALGARLTVQSARGPRTVPAESFFVAALTTALGRDELLTEIALPAWPARTGSSLQEVAIRRGDFALGGVAATLTLDAEGRVAGARIVCFGVGPCPVRAADAERSLVGGAPSVSGFAAAGQLASAGVDPDADIHASAAYRKRLVGVLTTRALAESLASLGERAA